jgi:hypothetical protein
MTNKTQSKDAGKTVFNMLAFQYKPLEKRFIAMCMRDNRLDIVEKYDNASYIVKIAVLDKYAGSLGL